MKLPSQPFTWSSSSLGLLLVFRTNTAFKRWDEGRKAWGQIINNSRTAVRLGTQWSDQEADGSKEKLKRLADSVWSFPRSLQYHLLGPLEDGADYARDLQKLSDPKFAADLLAVRHKPTRSLKEITQVLSTLDFKSVIYQVEAEKAVTSLCDALGACERIFTSPPPLFYSRHAARFLVVWVFLLPFCLWEPMGSSWNHWAAIPSSVVIAYFLLGIEELAAQMEEPFSILPMDKMTGGIRLSVDEHVEWKKFTAETFGDPYAGGYSDDDYGGYTNGAAGASYRGSSNVNADDNSFESFLRRQ
jgi:putative membrane protein